MVEKAERFPHIKLRLIREGIAISPPGGKREKSEKTAANLNDRWGHGNRLRNSASSVSFSWGEAIKKREEENKPPLPNAIPIILQIDPSAFDPTGLKAYGIEIIAELEDGYIIGASADLALTELQKKIEFCINGERGGGKITEIWEILDGTKRPEYILSEELLANWDQIDNKKIYTVDVGISCVGIKSQFSDSPKQKPNESADNFTRRVNNWINKRNQTEHEWSNLADQREQEFIDFIKAYEGKEDSITYGNPPSTAHLSDSLSFRIRISGMGLKDLVLNFPYVFDVSEPDQFSEVSSSQNLPEYNVNSFILESPELHAPRVCVIDSGIQEDHPLLKAAIDSKSSSSWLPGKTDETSDQVVNGGHGTRVAGALLYPQTVPQSGKKKAVFWIQNARVLDSACRLPEQLFPPKFLEDLVTFYQKTKTRIFNHSITASTPCRTQSMSAWAAAIDKVTWQNDVLFIVAAGNLSIDSCVGDTRLSVRDHLKANRPHPDYLLENSCRVSNPAQSFQALTVGSIAMHSYQAFPWTSVSRKDYPSAFSRSGLGIWDVIKPEVVEYGGDLVKDSGVPPNLTFPPAVCPELVRSTLGGGPAVASDQIGTSFSAPKVSHIAACLASELPDESCLLYRALIVQSARWPEWTAINNVNQYHVFRQIGYGIPSLERALASGSNRITLLTRGEQKITARKARVYQVKLPDELRSQAESYDILVEITLSYKAEPRRTRRQRRKYLSTWLDWDCSKKGEDSARFLERILKEYDASEETEKGEKIFDWTLGKQRNHGKIKELSRGAGTVQKDWTIVKSYDLREAFCIAVVGHEGWNNDPNAEAPYSLVISFEAVSSDVPIYASFAKAQVSIEIEEQVEVQV